MRKLGSLVGLFLLGCLGENPNYRPGGGKDPVALVDLAEGQPDLGGEPADLSEPQDPLRCEAGTRGCRIAGPAGGPHVSQACRDGRWADDRRCPEASVCQDGHCVQPKREGMFQGKACTRENDCFLPNDSSAYSCQPFVQPGGEIESYCAVQIGPGTPGTQCMPPLGAFCRSGFCDEVDRVRGGRSLNFCYRRCDKKEDCPYRDRYTCEKATVTVEGVAYSAGSSCVPIF